MSEKETNIEARSSEEHLEGLTEGAGCVEIWEHLSKRRGTDDS